MALLRAEGPLPPPLPPEAAAQEVLPACCTPACATPLRFPRAMRRMAHCDAGSCRCPASLPYQASAQWPRLGATPCPGRSATKQHTDGALRHCCPGPVGSLILRRHTGSQPWESAWRSLRSAHSALVRSQDTADAAGAPAAALGDAAADSGGATGVAAACPSSAAPGNVAGAAPGPSAGAQPVPDSTSPAASVASKHIRFRLEAAALALYITALKHAADPSAGSPRAWDHAMEVERCSRPARAALELFPDCGTDEFPNSMARLVSLDPAGLAQFIHGLRLAEGVLSRLAYAHAPPRAVLEVLELWVQEAKLAFRLDKTAAMALHPDTGDFLHGIDDASKVFSKQPALEREVFSAEMRASVRDAGGMDREVCSAVMAAALEQVRAGAVHASSEDTMRALEACEAAADRADELQAAREEVWAAAPGPEAREARAAKKAALIAERRASQVAAGALHAALAAQGHGDLGPPLGKAAGRAAAGGAATGTGNAPDSEEEVGYAVGHVAVAAGGGVEREVSEEWPDSDDESELHALEQDLLGHDAQAVVNSTKGRDMCACAPCSTALCP